MSKEDWGVKGVGWGRELELSWLRPLGLPHSVGTGPNQWASHFPRKLKICWAVRVPERDPLVLAGITAALAPEYGNLSQWVVSLVCCALATSICTLAPRP